MAYADCKYSDEKSILEPECTENENDQGMKKLITVISGIFIMWTLGMSQDPGTIYYLSLAKTAKGIGELTEFISLKNDARIKENIVPESDPVNLVQLVTDYLIKQGCYIIDREPTEEERLTKEWIVKPGKGGEATMPFRTDTKSPAGAWLTDAIAKGTGSEPVVVRIMGGTVPVAPFINALDIPAVIVPVVNPDNNQHGPDENLRILNFTNGICEFLSIMLM